jgi:hypothetical protein
MYRKRLMIAVCLSSLGMQMWGAEPPATPAPAGTSVGTSVVSASPESLEELRTRIALQQEQIKKLQQSMEEQQQMLTRLLQSTPTTATTAVAGNNPAKLIPALNTANVVHPDLASAPRSMQTDETKPSPLSINIGNTTFTPLGFIDATFFGRSTNVGSGIGTNFGGIPYNTSATGHIQDSNLSLQNSRIGFRVDSKYLGTKVLGYFEADFLGNNNTNVQVTSNSNTFRMRNVFVDLQKGGFEVLGGQDWSMATPNRVGISPIPSDIFYTQNMDTNYQAGLVWARQAQFRFIAHPSKDVALGVSFENPQQYIGGSGGLNAAAVTLPASTAISGVVGTQVSNASNATNSANNHPDIIIKGTYDAHVGEKLFHFEAVGLSRSFKAAYGLGTPVVYSTKGATAESGELNTNLQIFKRFRLIANTFFGAGNGRYVFGLAPDFIIRADGSISPIHTYSTVDGFEANLTKNTLFSAYYGGVYIGRDTALDTTGKTIGYGFTGSGTNDNRTIQEGTLSLVQTLWKAPAYGALSLIGQYSYLSRNPWSVATTGANPKETHTNMYWINLRYTLP